MGHSISNGVIQSLSVSQIATADTDQLGGCLRKWALEKLWGHKQPENASQETGSRCHGQNETYLTTGKDEVLGKITRAGKYLMPSPGSDLRIEWGLNDKPRPPPIPFTAAEVLKAKLEGRKLPLLKAVNWFPPQESLLTAGGIGLIGFIDVVNFRGNYVSPDGELLADPEGTVEVIDHKTTKNIAKYAKTADQLMKTVQMPGYGEFIRRLVPGLKFVRLSHIYYLTEGAPMARKVTKLVPVEALPVRWREIEVNVVEKMKAVAGAKRVEDVPGHALSCEAFRGCPYRSFCPMKQSNAMTRLRMSFISKKVAAGAAKAPITTSTAAAGAPPGVPPPPPASKATPVASAVPEPAHAASTPGLATVTYSCQATAGQPYVVGEVNVIAIGDNKFIPTAGGAPMMLGPADVIVPGAIPAHASAGLVPPPKPVVTAASAGVDAVNEAAPAKRGRKPKAAEATAAPDEAPATVPEASGGLRLYMNCLPTVINGLKMLDPYVAERVAEINKSFDTIDPRVSQGTEDPLSFGRWKALLGEAVRNTPPAPGSYAVITYGNELTAAVVEALIPLCSSAVRGIR